MVVLWLLRAWRRCGCYGHGSAARRHGAGEEGTGAARKARSRARRGAVARRHGGTWEHGEYGRWIEMEDEESRDPNVRLKRVRSTFYAMIGRGGRMTGCGGGSVRSQSSKLLERPDASDYARSDADRVRSYFARKIKTDDRTRWWLLGPDVVVGIDASDAASGHRSWRRPSGMTGRAGGRWDRTRW
jgi:hypothetical protein